MICPNYTTFRACFGQGQPPDATQMETWPHALVRAAGFGGAVQYLHANIPPITGWPVDFTCNGGAGDAVTGVDDYDWYLYQRTDDPTVQLFTVTRSALGSGSVVLGLNSGALAKLLPGIASPIDPDSLAKIFNRVALYARRRSDGAIDLKKTLP